MASAAGDVSLSVGATAADEDDLRLLLLPPLAAAAPETSPLVRAPAALSISRSRRGREVPDYLSFRN